ncbi:Septin-10 [Manis pentadactyla]|nr:Septin-10 [Manis pentadactyla]
MQQVSALRRSVQKTVPGSGQGSLATSVSCLGPSQQKAPLAQVRRLQASLPGSRRQPLPEEMGLGLAQKEENTHSLTVSGHVGFESLPHRLVNRSIQQGFCFNHLCGQGPLSLIVPLLTSSWETGTGKSTLIDTSFNTNFEDQKSSRFYPR